MPVTITSPSDVRLALLARDELALLDVREEHWYAKGHPLFAASLPLSRLELDVYDRIPRRDTRIVLYDDGEGLAERAAPRLLDLGYTDVSLLEGGLCGWLQAGLELFEDVNSASKAFGELVESRRGTPSLPADQALRLIESGRDHVVLDVRRFEEYQTMSVPGAISVPGAEVVLRAREIAPDPKTTIVVNCAGRTRSIIGAQSLINSGIPNPVLALRNGTIGWQLAGLSLEHRQQRRFPEPGPAHAEEALSRARAVAYRVGVRRLRLAELNLLLGQVHKTTYRFDVRTPEEYAAGHIPGFRSAPGGQLVQETDAFAPVRGARIALADDRGVRANMTASWLAQMGWDVFVLEGGFEGGLEHGAGARQLPPAPEAETLDPQGLEAALQDGRHVLIDLAPSPVYQGGHIPEAWFAIRSQLRDALAEVGRRQAGRRRVVLTSPDGLLARFAAPEVAEIVGEAPLVLAGGTIGWAASGRPLAKGDERMACLATDVYRRPYEGTANSEAAMQAYLDWEFGLVAQLERDGSHGFHVI